MKLEPEIMDVQVGGRWSGQPNAKRVEAEQIVSKIFDDFKKLMGTLKGRVLDIKEEGDPIRWPNLEEYRALSSSEKTKYIRVYKYKVRYIFDAINSRNTGPEKYKYYPTVNYVGDGKVILWWRYRKAVRGKNKKIFNEIGSK